jgi:molybdopterin converting factor small subunit
LFLFEQKLKLAEEEAQEYQAYLQKLEDESEDESKVWELERELENLQVPGVNHFIQRIDTFLSKNVVFQENRCFDNFLLRKKHYQLFCNFNKKSSPSSKLTCPWNITHALFS